MKCGHSTGIASAEVTSPSARGWPQPSCLSLIAGPWTPGGKPRTRLPSVAREMPGTRATLDRD